MPKLLLAIAAAALAGCGRYADFTLPPAPGAQESGRPPCAFLLTERPAPVLTHVRPANGIRTTR